MSFHLVPAVAKHSVHQLIKSPGRALAVRGFAKLSGPSAFESLQAVLPKMTSFFAGGASAVDAGTSVKRAVFAEGSSSHVRGGAKSDKRAHIYFLLDRSGSMQSIADDVIGGFNSFVKEQQDASADSAGLDMTMVQFDSQNPREVLFEGRDIGKVPPLCTATFRPRGATPLFDAVGSIIASAEATDHSDQQIVIVTFSDGQDNASIEHSKKSVFSRIEAKEKEGWTFVFLGANQDSYAGGGQLGYAKGNIQNFKFDSKGTHTAWQAVSGATFSMRGKLQRKEKVDNKDFFEGEKMAEDDFKSR